jgi:hypothetical protein
LVSRVHRDTNGILGEAGLDRGGPLFELKWNRLNL